MPKVKCDWTELIYDAGESTVGWACEMHIRSAPGATPAALILSTADGTLTVGQETDRGANWGIAADVPASDMNIAPGLYYLDLMRTDGGRVADLFEGEIVQWGFITPVTEIGLA